MCTPSTPVWGTKRYSRKLFPLLCEAGERAWLLWWTSPTAGQRGVCPTSLTSELWVSTQEVAEHHRCSSCWVYTPVEWSEAQSKGYPQTFQNFHRQHLSTCEHLPCAVAWGQRGEGPYFQHHKMTQFWLEASLATSKYQWFWRHILCEGKKKWNWVVMVISSSVSCYNVNSLCRCLLSDSKMPEAEMAGSRGEARCRRAACARLIPLHCTMTSALLGSVPRWQRSPLSFLMHLSSLSLNCPVKSECSHWGKKSAEVWVLQAVAQDKVRHGMLGSFFSWLWQAHCKENTSGEIPVAWRLQGSFPLFAYVMLCGCSSKSDGDRKTLP